MPNHPEQGVQDYPWLFYIGRINKRSISVKGTVFSCLGEMDKVEGQLYGSTFRRERPLSSLSEPSGVASPAGVTSLAGP